MMNKDTDELSKSELRKFIHHGLRIYIKYKSI